MNLSAQLGHRKVYVCVHVFVGSRSMDYVALEDGDLTVSCGGVDHEQSAEDWKLVGFDHLIERDASLASIGELPENHVAERSAGGPWTTSPIED